MKSHCVQTDTLAPSLKLERVSLLSQNGNEDIEKRVRKQIHACCMNRNRDSLTQHSRHQDKWQKWRKVFTPLHMRYIQSIQQIPQPHVKRERTERKTSRLQAHQQPHQEGLALCLRVILDSGAPVGPGRTPTVHRCLYGGRSWVAQHKLVNCFASNIRVRYLWSPFRSQSSRRDVAETWVVISAPRTFSYRLMLKVAPPGEWGGWTQPLEGMTLTRCNKPKKGRTSTGTPQTSCLASCRGGAQSGQ